METMLTLALLLLTLYPRSNSAEQVPCITNAATCEAAESQSVVNGKYHCCNAGFRMTWVKSPVNAQMECACDRYYHVSDCLEGQLSCQGATSMTTDGVSVKCCKHGAKMSSVSNTLYNGALQNYCRCMQYLNVAGYAALTRQDSMSPALQEMQMLAAMGLLPEEMAASISQMSGGGRGGGGGGAFSQFTTFLEGLLKGLTRSMNTDTSNTTSPRAGPVNRRRNRFPNLNNNNNNGPQGNNFNNNRLPIAP